MSTKLEPNMTTNIESDGKSPSILHRIESACKCGIHFVEDEVEKVGCAVESVVETVLTPFELCYNFIRRECILMDKTKIVIEELCDILSNLGTLIHGDPNVCGFISLLLWIGFCYNFDVWMVPLLIPFIFLRQFVLIYFNFIIVELDGPEPEKGETIEKSITEMLKELCDVCDSIDSSIEIAAAVIKTTKRTLRFKEPEICLVAILISLAAAIILYYIPLRYFIILASILSFCTNYLKVNGFIKEKKA